MWTLITGFLVMFMQAGFAAVETGLCRAKNANHTMMMNFMVYGFGMFAYWVMGFALQQGGCAGVTQPRRPESRSTAEFAVSSSAKDWGLFGTKGFFLSGSTYDVGVMVMFLFQMVFMDTAATIVTGAAAERWKFAAFAISSMFLAAHHLSALRQLGVGRRLAVAAGRQLQARARLLRLCRFGRGARRRRAERAGGVR